MLTRLCLLTLLVLAPMACGDDGKSTPCDCECECQDGSIDESKGESDADCDDQCDDFCSDDVVSSTSSVCFG